MERTFSDLVALNCRKGLLRVLESNREALGFV